MVVLNDTTIYQKTGPNPEDKEIFYPKTTWSQVIEKPSWIGDSKPSYTWSDITGKPDILLYSAQSLTDAQKAQARTNIDALSSADLSNFVTLNTVQTISADKTFSKGTSGYYWTTVKILTNNNSSGAGFCGVEVNSNDGKATYMGSRIVYVPKGSSSGGFILNFPSEGGVLALKSDITWANLPDKPTIPDVSKFITEADIPPVEVSVTGSGNAITSASVDTTNKHKVIFTKGTTFATTATATQSANGLMSSTDKKNLDDMVTLFGTTAGDTDTIVNTVRELLALFNQYPEGTTITQALAGKADKSALDNYVTLDTEQTISAKKTFNQSIDVFGGGIGVDNDADAGAVYGANGILWGLGGIPEDRDTERDGTWKLNFPAKSGTIVVDTDLEGYVTLDTAQTITGTKTFLKISRVGVAERTTITIKPYSGNNTQDHYGVEVWSTSGSATYKGFGIYYEPNGSSTGYALNFPKKAGTFLVDTDLPESLPPTGSAGGDLTGTYPNPTIKEGAVDDTKLSKTGVTAGYYSAVQTNEQGRIIKGANIFMSGTSETIPSNLATGGLYFYITNSRTVA